MAHGIQVRLAALAWATALAVAPLAAQGRDPREINGAKAPERIPDRYAYPMLFHRLTGPDAAGGRGIFLRDSRMGEADAQAVFREAERLEQLSSEGMKELAAAKKNAPRPLGPAVLDQYRVWNERMNDAVESAQRRLAGELSAAGQARLQEYLLNHVKRTMVVHLGDADIAAGLVPDSAPDPEARPLPPPLEATPPGEAEVARARKAAAEALTVLRVDVREKDATVELLNRTPHPVAAYQVALCAPALYLRAGLDTFGTGRPPIATGAVHDLVVSRRSRPTCDTMTPAAVAVLFDDGTGVGLAGELAQMKFSRLGRMAETWRVHKLLDAAPAGQLPDWAGLRRAVGEPPDGEESAMWSVIESGLDGLDPDQVLASNRAARGALFGSVAHVRATVTAELDRAAAAGAQSPLWSALREKYRAQCEEYSAFRRRSMGSLYR